MPRLARSGDRWPDIVLGDRYGTTCSGLLADLTEMVFSVPGWGARNRPYAGGFCTRTYGRPQHGVQPADRDQPHLYMNEVTWRNPMVSVPCGNWWNGWCWR